MKDLILLALFIAALVWLGGCSLPEATAKDQRGFWHQKIDAKAWGIYAVSPVYGLIGIGYVSYGRNVDIEDRDKAQPNLLSFPPAQPGSVGGLVPSK
jgi:hypothetical protein